MEFLTDLFSSSVSSLLSIGKDTSQSEPTSPQSSSTPPQSPFLSPPSPCSISQSPTTPPQSPFIGNVVNFFKEEKVPAAKYRNEEYFLEFKSNKTVLANITVKLFNDNDSMANAFKEFVTHTNGYGYKGSRVYAVLPGEWCLMGDLLYEANIMKNGYKGFHDRICAVEKPSMNNPRIHKGDHRTTLKETVIEKEERGSLVALRSSIHPDDPPTGVNMVGPQFKIVLNDQFASYSGRTFGKVVNGLEELKILSECYLKNVEPGHRVTISDCGRLS